MKAIQVLTDSNAKAGQDETISHNRFRLPGSCGSRFTTEIRESEAVRILTNSLGKRWKVFGTE